jgi:hypothetical protein
MSDRLYAGKRHCYGAGVRHVITLSTIPPRFADIGWTLHSMVRQQSRPEAVELYIPRSYRRFPQWGGALPAVPDGVTIRRTDADLGPATKILPAVRAYRGQEVELLYGDDDNLYAPDWAARFLAVRKAHPGAAVCAAGFTVQEIGRPWIADAPLPRAVRAPRAQEQAGYHLRRLVSVLRGPVKGQPRLRQKFRKMRRSGYTDIAEGFSGVALRPAFLDDDLIFTIPPVLWSVDDVWISGHLARRGVPIWADTGLNRAQEIADVRLNHALLFAVIDGLDRKAANLACVDHMRAVYGVWGGVAMNSR